MSPETALIVYIVIVTIMFSVWLVGIRFALGKISDNNLIQGEIEINAPAEALYKKIIEFFTSANGLGARIIESTRDYILFEGNTFNSCGLGKIEFIPRVNSVIVRYGINTSKKPGIMKVITYLVCFLYCGLFVFGVPVLIYFLVIKSPNPIIRFQAFQTLQMIHGVWPPFLLGNLNSRMKKYIQNTVENYLTNVRYTL